jgi:hypothetical protein
MISAEKIDIPQYWDRQRFRGVKRPGCPGAATRAYNPKRLLAEMIG